MATSGSYNWTLTRDEILKLSYQRVGILQGNSTLRSEQVTLGTTLLNAMLKTWHAGGIQMWKRKEATLFTAYQDAVYSLGSSGDHATTSYVKTQVATAAVSGASSLVVDSTSGMTAGDYLGIELDDGTRQWMTISTVTNSTTLALSTTLTDDVAVDNYVVTYTNKIQRPLSVINCRSASLATTFEQPMTMLSYDSYREIPDKTQGESSYIGGFYYDKQRTNGELSLYPRPQNVDLIINFTYHEPLQDMDSANDNFDFPEEWLLPIATNLAFRLARWFNLEPILPSLEKEAKEDYLALAAFDRDDASVRIIPNLTGNNRVNR